MDAPLSAANNPTSDSAPGPPISLRAGAEIFGRFTLLEQIGQGRCSTVWRADDPRFAREVALKIFRSSDPAAIEAEQKIWRELLRRIRSLNNANIAAPLEFLNDGSWIALCNPLTGGETLANHLTKAGKTWSLGEKENILKEVGLALVAAHEKAWIIHGNLNSFNIIIRKGGQPRITDFGFHPPLVSEDAPSAWKMACVSPERKAGGPLSQSDDLYAFAVIAYQILAGANPPLASGKIDLDAVGATLAAISARWSSPLKAALSADPAARPASIRAILQEAGLQQETSAPSAASSPAKIPQKHHAPSEKKRAGSWGFLILCLFFGLVLAAGIGWLIYESALENDKMIAERTAEEAVARAARLAAKAAETPVPDIDLEPRKKGTASFHREAAAPTATPLKINTGALDFLREGQAKFKAGNASGALESYDLALILQTGWPELLEARAAAQVADDSLADAVDEYTAALQIEPTRTSALLGRADVYITLGRYQNAQADFEAVLAADPQNAPAKAGIERLAQLKSAAK